MHPLLLKLGDPIVHVTPSRDGLPGAALIQKLLDWTGMLALWGSLGAILVGAAMYGLSLAFGSFNGASKGKVVALGGVVGVILAGIAPAAVNLLFDAAQTKPAPATSPSPSPSPR